ncbi:MAG TPA: hypothetical protein VK880_09530, partial [Anaerolineales bacterium]|nr:hypothetical protein [Anaerolineales bacterium]
AGWWMIPVGLIGSWVFLSTSFLVNDILSAASRLGVFAGVFDWLAFDPASQAYWSATLGQIGVLSGDLLDWAAITEAFTRTSLLQIILQISIGLLYLSWLAVWWARRRSAGRGQFLEG